MQNMLSDKRLESAKQYIDELSVQNSKLNIVRVDLSYKKPYSNEVSLDEVNEDIQHLLNNRRTKPSIFKDNIGYIMKREYAEGRGMHIHALFIFDGQKVSKSAHKADQIGKYWSNEITHDNGSYHNCHRNGYEKNGIGMLDHRDEQKRKILDEQVISYLCKEDQDVAPIKSNSKDRAFTRGVAPKKKSAAGRPRK